MKSIINLFVALALIAALTICSLGPVALSQVAYSPFIGDQHAIPYRI